MSGHEEEGPKLYGITAEFDEQHDLIEAAKATKDAGYSEFDAFSPFPVHGLADAMGIKRTILPWIVLCAGITGCLAGFYLQYWVSVEAYPMNVGGRPMNSWPSFVPVTFECTILLSGVTCLVAMLALNGLPLPCHPIFNTPNFDRATEDGFFLCIEATDPKFDEDSTLKFVQGMDGAVAVNKVDG